MKSKLTLLGLFLILATGHIAIGQTSFNYKEDFQKVLTQTKDKNDTLFYDKLLKRFTVNDTTLTDFEVLALLIGFTDKPEYKPYGDLAMEVEIFKLNEEKKYKEGLKMANTFLKTHPLSVKALFEKSYSFHKLGQADSAKFYMYQGHRIFKAMFFSGIGTSPDTPTFALGPSDGQDYITKFVGADIGSMGSGRDKNDNFLDILEAKFDDGQTATLYFIIQHATNKMFIRNNSKEEAPKETKKGKNK